MKEGQKCQTDRTANNGSQKHYTKIQIEKHA